jgi:transposase
MDGHEVLKMFLCLNWSGGQGEMLPHAWFPKRTVYGDFRRWYDNGMWAKMLAAGRAQLRWHAGLEPKPNVACNDTCRSPVSSSVRSTPGMEEHRPPWPIKVKIRSAGPKGFTPLEKCWVVERANTWHDGARRHRKDDERTPESSATMLSMSHIHLMLRRLTSHRRPKFHYPNVAATPLTLVARVSG